METDASDKPVVDSAPVELNRVVKQRVGRNKNRPPLNQIDGSMPVTSANNNSLATTNYGGLHASPKPSPSSSSIASTPRSDGGSKGSGSEGNILADIINFLKWVWLQIRKFNHSILTSPTSVYGAAPSLKVMKEVVKNPKNSATFRLPMFWYYFRLYFPYVFPVAILIFFIITISAWNTIEAHLMVGSILSLFGSLAVVISYFCILPWRKHPSTLILYRAISTVFFSMNLIDEARNAGKADNGFYSCRSYAFFTHITLLVGECWLTSIASDLVNSLTNPFSSYQSSLNRFLIYCNLFSLIVSYIFYTDDTCQGNFSDGVCWLKVTSLTDPCLWGYYLIWILLMYIYQIWSVTFAYFRLKRGLSTTFEIRKKTAEATFRCLMSYAVYLLVIIIFFSILASNPNYNLSLVFLFIIANRGSVDAFVWFSTHDFERDVFPFEEEFEIQFDRLGSPITKNLKKVGRNIKDLASIEGMMQMKSFVENTISEVADLAIAEYDETDLSPQVNLALRKQVIEYVTKGVIDSIRRIDLKMEKKATQHIDEYMEHLFKLGDINNVADPADIPGLGSIKFYLDGEHCFKSYAEGIFSQLRSYEGVTDDYYLKLLSKPTKERLSEGASGAFMFFCGDGEFIVKTIRAREAKVLHESLIKFNDYIKANPQSFLCRFLGSYSLQMFEQTFYFVVMLNCFDPAAKIQERYDIKGSWVGRSADPIKMSKKTVCRHCNTYFVPNQYEQCKVIVGFHEPNVVLKDNDLRTRLFFDKADTEKALSILRADSDLLGELGVLDYSLILGVKKQKFDVEITRDMMGLPADTIENGKKAKRIGDHCYFKSKSVTGPAVFHLGVIDFLQNWTFFKRVERAFKIYVLRKDPDGLSVMHPDYYMIRFQRKMEQIFDQEILRDAVDGEAPSNGDDASSMHLTHFSKASAKTEIAVRRRSSFRGSEYAPVSEAEINPLVFDDEESSSKSTIGKSSAQMLSTIVEASEDNEYGENGDTKPAEFKGQYLQFDDDSDDDDDSYGNKDADKKISSADALV